MSQPCCQTQEREEVRHSLVARPKRGRRKGTNKQCKLILGYFHVMSSLPANWSDFANHRQLMILASLVPRPSEIGGGEGLVHTVCTCVLIKVYVMTKMMHTCGPGKPYDVYV